MNVLKEIVRIGRKLIKVISIIPKGIRLAGLVLWPVCLVLGAETLVWADSEAPIAMTTYERLLPLGEAGNDEIQNMLGFMFFHGEGVPQDYEQAHDWFHRSANAGNRRAWLNLLVFHSGEIELVPSEYSDKSEAVYWEKRLKEVRATGETTGELSTWSKHAEAQPAAAGHFSGQRLYETFCGGCHGFNGISYYVHSPSFALNERLDKSDARLLHSISNGLNSMPPWGSILSQQQIADILQYLRQLAPAYQDGILHSIRGEPELYFRFKPYGGSGEYWKRYERYRQAAMD